MTPDKPNILLVHGAWDDASHWRHVIPPLHEKGYRVFAGAKPSYLVVRRYRTNQQTGRCARCSDAISWPCVWLRGHYCGRAYAQCRRARLFGRTCSR
jgi:pimeloyl-ACP methyl ester carboxylesterase